MEWLLNECKACKAINLERVCRAPLHIECPQHHGHKGDPVVIPGICGVVGDRAQIILVWLSVSPKPSPLMRPSPDES